jgi:hypothetical protein
MRPRELDEATKLAKRLGDPELASILEGVQLPEGYDQQVERVNALTAEQRARELLDDIRARAERCFDGQEGDAAQQVVERWGREHGVTAETLKKAAPAALGRLHDVLSRLPRPRHTPTRGRGAR